LDAEVEEAITRFGIESLADRKTSQLSGGEKQIVAVACAMMSHRSIIVLDEPTSHLDREGKELLWRFLDAAAACENPQAIVVVTQYAHEVSHFDRVIVLDSGSIIHDGPPLPASPTQIAPTRLPITPPKSDRQPVLSVKGLTQVEDSGWEIPESPPRDVTLSIRPGEAIALCGPIGAGKTTLALHLAGLVDKFDGERSYQGRPPVMIMQFPERQIFCRSVEEEVAYGLIARGMPKTEALSESSHAMTRVGLDPAAFRHRDPFSLSGGQKRRVMLAVASAIPSDLYILDEPQAALDDDGLAALDSLCRSWHEQEIAYIVISHDYEVLRSLTTRVIALERGRVAFDGLWPQFDDPRNQLPSNKFG
jgi:energy-coupling factor transport system ATP-binding protein